MYEARALDPVDHSVSRGPSMEKQSAESGQSWAVCQFVFLVKQTRRILRKYHRYRKARPHYASPGAWLWKGWDDTAAPQIR